MYFRKILLKIQKKANMDAYINSDSHSYSASTITFIYTLHLQRKKKTKN